MAQYTAAMIDPSPLLSSTEDAPVNSALPQQAATQRHWRRLAGSAAAPWLHVEVSQRMAERLSFIKVQPSRVLQWGAFLGGSDVHLRAVYPQARQLLAEPDNMLLQRSLASQANPWWAPWRRSPIEDCVKIEAVKVADVELVWANMFLHHAPDHLQTLRAWHRALAVDGFVMFSCLGPDSFKELRAVFDDAAWGPSSPPWVDMHDLGDMMVQTGFADPVMDQECITLTWGESAALLDDLRALGGNAHLHRFAGMRTPSWRERLLAALEGLRRADGRIAMSLEVVYGHAFKPQPKIQMNTETRVSLDEMRDMVRRKAES